MTSLTLVIDPRLVTFADVQRVLDAVETLERFATRGVSLPDIVRGQKAGADASRAGYLSGLSRKGKLDAFERDVQRLLRRYETSDDVEEGPNVFVASALQCCEATVRRARKRLEKKAAERQKR
jgi:hypothetical protein